MKEVKIKKLISEYHDNLRKSEDYSYSDVEREQFSNNAESLKECIDKESYKVALEEAPVEAESENNNKPTTRFLEQEQNMRLKKMKVNKKLLVDFLKKVSFEGTSNMIAELVVDFSTEGLKVQSMDASNTCMVEATLDKSTFEDYQAVGKVGVGQTSVLIKNIDKIASETIEVSVNDNLLVAKGGNRKVYVELIDISNMDDVKVPSLDYNDGLQTQLNISLLKNIVSDIESYDKSSSYTIDVKPGSIVLSNREGSLRLEETIIVDTDKEFSVMYSEPLASVIKNLDGDVELFLKEEYPATLVESMSDYKVKVIAAPCIIND